MRTIGTLCLLLLFAASAHSQTPASVGVYHEAACPAVDKTRMVKLKRGAAEASGLLPAADCHPDAPVRYLGTFSGSWGSVPAVDHARPKTQHVSGYMRNGKWVDGYDRALAHRD